MKNILLILIITLSTNIFSFDYGNVSDLKVCKIDGLIFAARTYHGIKQTLCASGSWHNKTRQRCDDIFLGKTQIVDFNNGGIIINNQYIHRKKILTKATCSFYSGLKTTTI